MSPEQAEGEGELDGRSDLYSLGIVLHEMLTGRVPYDADTTIRIALKHIKDDLPRLPEKFSHLQPILEKLLQKKPEERYSSARELLDDLERLNPAKPSAFSPPVIHLPDEGKSGIAGIPAGAGRRRKALAAGSAALAFVVGAVFFFGGNNQGGGEGDSAPPPLAKSPLARKAVESDPLSGRTEPRKQLIDLLQKGKAILSISVDPADANLFLNGEEQAPLPYFRQDLPAGKVLVRLESPYHQPFETSIDLVDNVVNDIKEFRLEPGLGNLTILSDPPNALLVLDGKDRAETTPATLAGVTAGIHDILVDAGNCRTHQERVELFPNETKTIDFRLPEGLVSHGGKCLPKEEVARAKQEKEVTRVAHRAAELLEEARLDIKANRLKTPEGRNALEKYREVLGLIPGSDEAMVGIEQLITRYLSLAETELQKFEVEEAAHLIDQAKSISEEFPLQGSKHLAGWEKFFSAFRDGRKWLAAIDRDKSTAAFERALAERPSSEAARLALSKAKKLKKLGETFTDILEDGSPGPPMVLVPSGSVELGGSEYDRQASKTVSFVKPFAIGIYEVTFEEYARFCRAQNRPLPQDNGWGTGRHPVINVSWKEARDYAAWVSRQTGKHYRLPSESEWEYTARAGSISLEWWKNNPSAACTKGNIYDRTAHSSSSGKEPLQCDDGFPFTAPVGSYRPNKFGLYDTSGNVMEWCLDSFSKTFKSHPADGSSWTNPGTLFQVVRGSSWSSPPPDNQASFRAGKNQIFGYENVGFRLARDL